MIHYEFVLKKGHMPWGCLVNIYKTVDLSTAISSLHCYKIGKKMNKQEKAITKQLQWYQREKT